MKDITDMEEQMSKLMEILELTQEDYDERAKIAKYIQVKNYFILKSSKNVFHFFNFRVQSVNCTPRALCTSSDPR